jgi:hypothetical protein
MQVLGVQQALTSGRDGCCCRRARRCGRPCSDAGRCHARPIRGRCNRGALLAAARRFRCSAGGPRGCSCQLPCGTGPWRALSARRRLVLLLLKPPVLVATGPPAASTLSSARAPSLLIPAQGHPPCILGQRGAVPETVYLFCDARPPSLAIRLFLLHGWRLPAEYRCTT